MKRNIWAEILQIGVRRFPGFCPSPFGRGRTSMFNPHRLEPFYTGQHRSQWLKKAEGN